MEIKKGTRWVCIEDVYMHTDFSNEYKRGFVYLSESEGCITDESGDIGHWWTRDLDKDAHFIPYSKLDRVYTKYTERLEKLFDDYDGKKYKVADQEINWYCNCDVNDETGWFLGDGRDSDMEEYYKGNGFTYLSEQAFIEFMGLTDTTDTKAPQPHYDNSNGSLFSLAEQLGLNHWEFDILKRLVRCRKKGQFKEDLQKIKDTCDIYLREYK